MICLKNIYEYITIGNGQATKSAKVVKNEGMVNLENGQNQDIILKILKYVPDLSPYTFFKWVFVEQWF